MNDEQISQQQHHQQLRQLSHDIKTHLAIVTMGIDALEGIRDDQEQFRTVADMIRQEGVEPLKETLATLLELACQPPN